MNEAAAEQPPRDQQLRGALAAVLAQIAPEADQAAIDPTLPLREQLDLDSMDFLRFVIALDKRLGVQVPERDYPLLATLDGCVSYLEARLGSR